VSHKEKPRTPPTATEIQQVAPEHPPTSPSRSAKGQLPPLPEGSKTPKKVENNMQPPRSPTPPKKQLSPIRTQSPPKKREKSPLVNSSPGSQFIHAPSTLKFGTVKQGGIYRLPFMLRNVGTESGRFNVKPPTNKNIQVVYSPGPVAPGIAVWMEVELKAMDLGNTEEEIRIDTGGDTLRILVSATVSSDSTASPNQVNFHCIHSSK
jgi:hypothetical protein